jgi:hypothetical protein
VIERLKGFGAKNIRSIDGVSENTVFKLPQELVDAAVELELKKA